MLLLLSMLCVTTATASASTTTKDMKTCNPCTFSIQKGYTDGWLNYYPMAKGTKTFNIVRIYPTSKRDLGLGYSDKNFQAIVYFYWSNDGKTWNSFGAGKSFGTTPATQTLVSGDSNIRYRMRVFSTNSLIASKVTARIY